MVKRVVLTGGPGSGKTTVLESIIKVFESQGVKVVVVPETATEIITAGIRGFGDDPIDMVDFQELIMRLQLAKEDVYDRAADMYEKQYPDKDILIVYDRGTIDNTAYINKEEFEDVLSRLNNVKSFSELMNKYDLVLNLVGKREFYTTENNKARSEDADTALALGENTLRSWFGHEKIKIVLPRDEMSEKINEALNYINEIFDIMPVKRQQKFLIDLNSSDLSSIKSLGKVADIEQAYLISDDNVEKRIRRIIFNDCVSYRLTVYRVNQDGEKCLVSEKQIDEKIYKNLMEFKVPGSNVIRKKRYYFSFEGKYMYVDIFENDNELGILEVNVNHDEKVSVPDFVSVMDEVSTNKAYFNQELANIEKGWCLKK